MFPIYLLSALVFGQEPSLCDKYTTALLTNNTEANQLAVLTLVVNTVVLGNLSATVTGAALPSLLAPAEFNGEKIDLLGYFNGSLETTNVDNKPAKVNFLDGEAAGSKQSILLKHLYQVFGSLLGCSKQGGQIFAAYQGDLSMYETHKFMKLNKNQISFFNTQVEKAALSLGVTAGDATTIKNTLEAVFNVQCAAPAKVGGLDGYQGLCATSECKVADPKNCPSDFKSSAKGMFTGSWLLVVAMLAVSL